MTLKQLLAQSTEKDPDKVAFQFKQNREWHQVTYEEFLARVWCVTELLAELGVQPGDRVAVWSENSIHWPAMYFGAVGVGATAVPVDAKLKEQETAHILRDSAALAVLTTSAQYPVLREIERSLPKLKHVIMLDARRIMPADSARVTYHDYTESVERALDTAHLPSRVYDQIESEPDDIASFIYTSGTTGRQKGAMISHGNFTANVASCQKAFNIHDDESFLLVLPLHHAFAFTGNLLLPLAGTNTVSLVESLRTVGDNIREVSPTAFIAVPLLVEKMYIKIMEGLRKNKVAYAMYKMGLRGPVRKGISKKLGGRLRIVATGGAPCDPEILIGFERLGIHILEGYGLTETSPVVSLNPEHKPKPGSIGLPLENVEVRIDEPDADGIGEIVIQGPNVMKGYFNDPAATAAAFKDGWFLTGDLGRMDSEGYIYITGRKKSLIVNREGKNIYPEEVEIQALRSPFILEALVLGYQEPSDNVGERVGIIVVPNTAELDEETHRRGHPLLDKEVVELLRSEVKRECGDISNYKRPRKILVRMGEFEKTSTGKVKRYLYDLESTEI